MIDLSQYSWKRLCPELYNLKDFKETHPSIDPVSQGEAYHKYWKSIAKKFLEGAWGHDYDPIRNLGGYRYISPVCYFYINGWKIDMEAEDSKTRNLKPPKLVDIVLIHSYAWHCARGFSGFENDTENTCCRPVEKLHKKIPLNAIDELILKRAHKNIFKPNGDLKHYVNAYEYLWQTFEKPLGRSLYDNEANNLINIQARRGGKDLEDSTPVYTVNGPIPIKDIQIGDFIYDHTGKLTEVIAKKHFNDQVQYEITFGDNRKILCGEGHLWTLLQRTHKNNKATTKIFTTELKTILNSYKRLRKNGRYEYKYWIPSNKAISKSKLQLPLDPYFVGLWLGDGHSHTPAITTMDNEIRDYVYEIAAKYNCRVNVYKNKSCPTYSICNLQGKLNPVKELLKEYNLINNKRIPNIYLNSCIEDRLELLRGLMDSDGYSDSRHIEFSSSNPILADNFETLVRELGISCYRTLKQTNKKPSHRFTLKTDLDVFKLERKKRYLSNLHHKAKQFKLQWVCIKNITKVGVMPSTCISVANEDKLFLAGNYIVTHNSSFFACASYHEFLTYGKKYYDEDYFNAPRGTNTTIVSAIKDKSEKFFKMVQDGANYLNTELGSFNGSPGYFHRQHYGSFAANSTYYHGVEITKTVKKKKVTTKYGSGATLSHLVATVQNPDVGAGGAQSVGGIEEFGLMKNSAHVLKSGFEPAMTGTLKFGSLFGIGTGGNIDKVQSSKELMENPLGFKCIGFKDTLEGRAHLIGLFVPSYMTKFEFKDENGNTLYEEAWAYETALIQDLIENADRRTLELHLQANPLVLSHVYLGAKGSHFPTAYIGEALRRMDIYQTHKKLGTPGILRITDYTTRTVTFTPDHLGLLTPIIDYKTDNYVNQEGCVMVYEAPDPYEHYDRFYPAVYHNLYKITYDSIKDPGGGPSFACIQVWKGIGRDFTRMQNTLVAEYIGRMDNPNDMDYIACCLAIWYGARILYEQNVNTLLNYCMVMEMLDLLQPTPYESIKKAIKEPKKKYKTGMVMSDELKSKADLWGTAWLITEVPNSESSEKRYRCDYLCSRRLLQEFMFYEVGKNFDCISTWRIYIVWIQQEIEPNEEIQKARLNEAKKIAQRNASTLIQDSPSSRSIWRV